jgi:large repetitive protein
MRGILALAIALAGPGIGTSFAQTVMPPMPSLPATSPLQAGPIAAGTAQNASPNLGLTNSTTCPPANPSTATLPTFDGGGLNLGSTATPSSGGLNIGSTVTPSSTVAQGSSTSTVAQGAPSSTVAQANTVGLMGAAAGTSAPCSATNGSSTTSTGMATTSTGMATASSPITSSLGTTGLGTGGLGTTALGTAGLVSSPAGSASTPTSTSQTTATLAGSTGSATICATNLGTMSASAGMSTADQIGQGAGGAVADPAETLANTIPSPALTLSGSASVPNLAGSCANMP